ncbi:MAG: RIP metalloprotease RseP [Acidobacteria bacterium]|nr:MAG: RIP metalloprotease RseP [Acidobacteriota bacterium]
MVSSFLTDAVVVIVVLGVMVFVHEAGHFLAAKGFGVRVLTFSLGFGKRIFGFERGGTDYRVSILPLGGYVKMAGDDPTAVLTGDRGEFLGRPRWQRFVIVLMGPMMNFVLAVVVLAGLYMFHFQKPAYEDQPVVIGAVDSDSAAAVAGLQAGDRVVQFDGIRDPQWHHIKFKVLTGADHPIPLTVDRGGQVLHMSLTPHTEGPDGAGVAGWYPYVPLVIDKAEPGQPASDAGLKSGDMIVGLDGKPIYYWALVVQALRDGKGNPVDLTVERDGKEFQAHLKPAFTDVMGLKTWRIGVTIRQTEFVVRRLPPGTAVDYSIRANYRYFLETFDVLGKIVTRQMSTKSLAGPIGIAQISGEAYRRGIADLLLFVSFISLQLGIVNLLPIPVMDGGHIFMLAIEGLMRRDLSLAVKERVIQVGVVLIVLLFVFVMYNDIMKSLRPS